MKNILFLATSILILSCTTPKEKETKSEKVKLMTLDPGHFHAALVHKSNYAEVDSNIYVFAPEGPEVNDFLLKIGNYNSRAENSTNWNLHQFLGDNYLEKMITDKPGNVMVVAGKNSKKIDYILAAVKAGLNVYADKPLVINEEGFKKLEEAFRIAQKNNVMIYDIMTERFEATTVMQKEISKISKIFGEASNGTSQEPTISKESVHHFFKNVSGSPLVRPAWFFDVNEEGEGIVDVTTHLVDLVQWELFPNQIIKKEDIEILEAKHWPTILTLEQFAKVTKLDAFPNFLQKNIVDNKLEVMCNGEMTYKIKDKIAKVSVIWNFEAPEGTGDTHYSILNGTKSNIIIKQGKNENYKPTLYIELKENPITLEEINQEIKNQLGDKFLGTKAEKIGTNTYKVIIPDEFKISHEAHFAQVTNTFLQYLKNKEIPEWEVPNMITKYYTTTQAYKKAQIK